MKRNTILVITILTVITLLSCSYENTATVTIDTGIRQQAQMSLFDKVLAFLSLSQPLQADPPPPLDLSEIVVNVTAGDMQTITKNIPLDTGRITLEVPAGNQRTFEVVAGYGDGTRIYGGITTIDLSPGQNVNLTIEMGELNNNFYYYYYHVEYKYMDTEYSDTNDPTTGVIAFKIYESDDYMYTNEKLKHVVTNWTSVDYEGNWVITIPIELKDIGTKYYRCAVVNKYGEGNKVEISEY